MVDQLFVIISYKRFLKKFKRKQNEGVKASGINPLEESKLDRSQKTAWDDSEMLN